MVTISNYLAFLLLCGIIWFQYQEIVGLNSEMNSLKTGRHKTKEEKFNLLYFLFFIVLCLWLIGWLLMDILIDTSTARGTFGDKFGSINSLFSGFALAGIVYTVYLQKKELSLQRLELEQTREEFKIQNITLKKQRFENTFFQLQSLHNEIIDKLKIDIFDGNYEKKAFFEGAIKQLKYKSPSLSYYKFTFYLKLQENEIKLYFSNKGETYDFLSKLDDNEIREMSQLTSNDIHDFLAITVETKEQYIQRDYLDFFIEHQHSLGHYFRNLYHIFKYIYYTDLIVESEKPLYSNLMRAQLSSGELVLLFYNSLTPIRYFSERPNLGFPKFKYLIDHYDILQNMSHSLLLDKDHFSIFEKNKVNSNPF